MIGSRVLGFTKGFQACSLNDSYFYTVGCENSTTAIDWSSNTITNAGQSAEFHGCAFYQHSIGWAFGNAVSYQIRMFGGQFYGFQPSKQHVVLLQTTSAPNLNLTFTNVEFNHGSNTNTNHFLMLGNYDNALNTISCIGCYFVGSVVKLSRGAGTASFSNWMFNSCNFVSVTVQLDITDKGQILGGNFYDSKITLTDSQYITIKDITFFGLSGVGIEVTNANCGFNYFAGNQFISVSTPIVIFNNATNDTIFMENNLGVTASPNRGKIVDNRNNIVFANLGTPANGSMVYCPDGTAANPVAGAGTGCIAKRLNGVWIGN